MKDDRLPAGGVEALVGRVWRTTFCCSYQPTAPCRCTTGTTFPSACPARPSTESTGARPPANGGNPVARRVPQALQRDLDGWVVVGRGEPQPVGVGGLEQLAVGIGRGGVVDLVGAEQLVKRHVDRADDLGQASGFALVADRYLGGVSTGLGPAERAEPLRKRTHVLPPQQRSDGFLERRGVELVAQAGGIGEVLLPAVELAAKRACPVPHERHPILGAELAAGAGAGDDQQIHSRSFGHGADGMG